MVTSTSLKDQLAQKVREIKETVAAVGEEKGSRRPTDTDWCVKEILSHLCGDEGVDPLANYNRFITEDTPMIGIVRGLPYYTPSRQAMTVSDLLAQFESQYGQVGTFLGGLTEEQLNRKGRVPLLKDTPLGEYPTLAVFAGGLINFHLTDHLNQLRAICQ